MYSKLTCARVGNPVWLAPEIMRKDKTPEYTEKVRYKNLIL